MNCESYSASNVGKQDSKLVIPGTKPSFLRPGQDFIKGRSLGGVPGPGIGACLPRGWSALGHPQVISFGENDTP